MSGALILDGHSRAAVEATQALGRAAISVTVASATSSAAAFHSRYASEKLLQPPTVPSAPFLEWLREIDSASAFDLIIASTESTLLPLLALAEDDPLRSRAVIPSNRALRVALDKHRTCELALELGVPVPASRLITHPSEIGEALALPSVLKPVQSKLVENGVLRTFEPAIVRDAALRRTILEEWTPRTQVIEQEYVQGWGVGIEMLYQNGKRVWHLAHERLHEWPMTGGASTYRRAIAAPPAMLDAATRLLDALNWHGAAMVEFKRRADGSFALMEINPRLWGSLALSIDAGVNFPLGMFEIATGKPLAPQPRYKVGLRTRHLSKDLRWLRANLAADRRNPLLLLRPRLSSLFELAHVFLGHECWDHFDWRDLGPFRADLTEGFHGAATGAKHRNRVRNLEKQATQLCEKASQAIRAAHRSRRPKIVFVCQANICRSPFAEVVARRCIAGCDFSSAGLDARVGRVVPPNVAGEARSLGLDIVGHRSLPLTAEIAKNADALFVMEVKHYDQMAARFPQFLHKTFLLGLFAEKPAAEIPDPNFKDAATTRRVNAQIEEAIQNLARRAALEQPKKDALEVLASVS